MSTPHMQPISIADANAEPPEDQVFRPDIQHPKPPAESEFTISVQMDGFPVSVKFTGNAKRLRAAIDALKAAGASPPPVRTFGGGGFQKRDDRVKPTYDGAGDPCCPVHGKKLNEREWEGRKFWSCPAKATGEEKANAKGYCALKFDV